MEKLTSKLLQYITSIGGGILCAFEGSIDYLFPCLMVVLLDVFTAWSLGRRMHKKYPEHADGKFKSNGKWRVLETLMCIFICVILANFVDTLILRQGNEIAARFSVGMFIGYELWSCLENWSSENDNKLAKILQRVMINKAERHLQVPLKDILMPEEKSNTNKERKEK